ncbi:unnamed protein product [Leptidea sinapis]|uniref:LITAF domain-containing protein n=1 Tax=Leptidea sinapis TaxID=189913 RepID=A0A5E4PZ40_9NEOP|nr:unnamed protein product [Leptidea sinapis]
MTSDEQRKAEGSNKDVARRTSIPDTVYIDIPGQNDSLTYLTPVRQSISNATPTVSTSNEMREDHPRRSSGSSHERFVEETIFYDPFGDKRIMVSSEHSTTTASDPQNRLRHAPPPPPQGSSNTTSELSSQGHPKLQLPPPHSGLISPEPPPAYVEIERPFSEQAVITPQTPVASPHCSSQFHPSLQSPSHPHNGLLSPEPPPAYNEIDRGCSEQSVVTPQTPVDSLQTPQTSTAIVTRTGRKHMVCPFCKTSVHTLVVRESGPFTHLLALILFMFCMPIIFLAYCCDICKYKNHYCPNCNKVIGYETPLLCTGMVYTKASASNHRVVVVSN